MRNTTEGNKLIAEFMGFTYHKSAWITVPNETIETVSGDEVVNELLFHSSWNWLMPVVEKIESFGYWVKMDYGDIFIVDDDSNIIVENPMHEDGYTKLSLVWQVVVEFIKRK